MTNQPALAALPPGATIGILGGGQLGRMLALAAARLGYRCHAFCPDPASPAFEVSAAHTVAAYDDHQALAGFAAKVDVITYEFENIALPGVEFLAGLKPVRPDPAALAVGQHRPSEKRFFERIGAAVPPWRIATSAAELAAALAEVPPPAVAKTTRLGYDGKGQVKLMPGQDPEAAAGQAWAALASDEVLVESFVDFVAEVSVVVARGLDGAAAAFDPAGNVHRDHILHTSTVPARLPAEVAEKARRIALDAAEALDLVGVMAVEMFVTADHRLLVNEMAPRVHNSGHWTQDACLTDQFEQHIRAICGLPLGSPLRLADAEMTNLLGEEANPEAVRALLAEPGACLHLYGKAEARPGRKMGHVNRLRPWRAD
ncbi:5-(carboxyamino)imidazole ribonucleotide synthase [Roseospirillum parvum]|uniref:N5-carboxyaminoimidazole ribonucleotide synthase n=1 Tax=Roseospirillum parvum TaxID=83401 RepID=A0A1G7UY34_9PROT|nr:5-(carboxyamino)imidazole ribonucleotide synthase [Roseospirillum parvum]SDG52515.1 5-(carboxyamino)imidazole ribonucleotide synthase [Roseospirillum parvum]